MTLYMTMHGYFPSIFFAILILPKCKRMLLIVFGEAEYFKVQFLTNFAVNLSMNIEASRGRYNTYCCPRLLNGNLPWGYYKTIAPCLQAWDQAVQQGFFRRPRLVHSLLK